MPGRRWRVVTLQWDLTGGVGPSEAAGGHIGDAGMCNATQLTVLLADDQIPARAGIKSAIEPHGLRVVAEAASAADALHMAVAHRPDVCVIAVALPGNGIDAARQIKESLPANKIVMMTGSPSDEDLFGALRAGADGYLLMSTSASRLPHAILGVAHGEAALPR